MRYIIFSLMILMLSCKSNSQSINGDTNEETVEQVQNKEVAFVPEIVKTDSEWKEILSEEEFYVLRKAGTERPFTGDLLNNKKAGIYTCAACDQELFSSATKFDSGTGWPSYYEPIREEFVHEATDYKLGYPRTEVLCGKCGGHLGHVFDDGPKPTGLRYCMNSVAMNFKKK